MGDRRLDAALQKFSHKDQVEILYRSFELDPHAEKKTEGDYYGKLAKKYGMSREQAIESCKNMENQAQSVGLEYHFDTIVMTNTFDAHRLSQYAAQKGKMGEMVERLFHAYFTESKHIGDHQTLVELAAEVGLDPEEARQVLESQDFTNEVRQEEQEAAALGVRGVPFYVINRKYGVSGAQPTEVFLNALEKAWQEEHPLTMMNEEGEVCDESGCHIPQKDK